MSWLTGKPKTKRQPVTCRPCGGAGWIPRFGLAPGGRNVRVGLDRCRNCGGSGTV